DADELIYYPRIERIPLQGLCRYLAERRATALRCLLVDLYPEGPVEEAAYRVGMDPREVARFFDVDLSTRRRVFGASPFLRRVPLFFFETGMKLGAGHPHLSPVVPIPLSGAVLHCKFLQDFASPRLLERRRSADPAGDPAYAAELDAYVGHLARGGPLV